MGFIVMFLHGCGSKLNRRGYAGFGPCFHLPGQPILGTGFLSHSQIGFFLGVWSRVTGGSL